MTDAIFLLQLVAAVALGGFVGEFYRTTLANGVVNRVFIAKFLAGAFLAGMLGYVLYLSTKNKPLSIIVASLLSYQEEDFISGMARHFLENIMNSSETNQTIPHTHDPPTEEVNDSDSDEPPPI